MGKEYLLFVIRFTCEPKKSDHRHREHSRGDPGGPHRNPNLNPWIATASPRNDGSTDGRFSGFQVDRVANQKKQKAITGEVSFTGWRPHRFGLATNAKPRHGEPLRSNPSSRRTAGTKMDCFVRTRNDVFSRGALAGTTKSIAANWLQREPGQLPFCSQKELLAF